MVLISPGRENPLDFLKLLQVLSTYTGTSGTHSVGLRKGLSPCELLGETHGIPLPSMPGPKTFEELVP